MAEHPDIEAVALKLLELRASAADPAETWGDVDHYAVALHTLAPQLADYVLKVTKVVEAARLRRNIITDHPHLHPVRFLDPSEWVTIPREDFDRLRDALASLDSPPQPLADREEEG